MNAAVRNALLFVLSATLSSLAPSAKAALDAAALDKRIEVKLHNASLSDAALALSKIGGVEIAAPVEPKEGISMSLKDQTLRLALDLLSRSTGLEWAVVEDAVVFRPPARPPQEVISKDEPLTPERATAFLLASLDADQLYRLSWGYPLSYGELSEYQQGVLRAMLTPKDATGTDASGAAGLPAPEQISISFHTIPYLLVPVDGDEKPIRIRLDSTEYLKLGVKP